MSLKGKKVLVTGAAGFIGSHLCELLLDKGYKVIGLDLKEGKRAERLKKNKNFQIIKGDIRNFEEVFKLFKKYKPKGIFHTAALIPQKITVDSPLQFFEVNVKGTFNLLEACRLLSIKKFVYSSSMSVYGKEIKHLPVNEKQQANPADFYGLTKFGGEELCNFYAKKYNLDTVILRYSGVWGQGRENGAVADFIKNAFSNKPLEILSDTSWDIVYVKDVAVANVRAFERADDLKSKIINIGSGKEINIKELAKKIIYIIGSKSKIKLSKTLPHFRFYLDISRAKKLLGLRSISFDKALVRYLKDIKNY